MRSIIISATLATMAFFGADSTARADRAENLVRSWYARYLHRRPDAAGLREWVNQLRNGVSAEQVQAGILGSDEYYKLHGSNPSGFVYALYVDVLGRRPSDQEVQDWVDQFDAVSNLPTLALQFLEAARGETQDRKKLPPP